MVPKANQKVHGLDLTLDCNNLFHHKQKANITQKMTDGQKDRKVFGIVHRGICAFWG